MRFSLAKQPHQRVIAGLAVSLATLSGILPAAADAFPDPAVEARTARELMAVESKIPKPSLNRNTDQSLANIATSLARLGRLEAALQVAGWLDASDDYSQYGAPQVRVEVLRLVVRRRCVYGKVEEARQLIPAITVAELRADALLALSRAYLRRGEHEKARRTLYQVSPLVDRNIQAISYTAYLLSKTGDLEGAKRLFARAQTQLTPFTPLKKPENEPWHDLKARNERSALVRSLFKAGLVDEAIRTQEASRIGQKRGSFISGISSDELTRINRFNDALRLAREEDGLRGINSRIYLAAMLYQHKKDREGALAVLVEAEAEYRRFFNDSPDNGQQPGEERRDFGRRIFPLAFMAWVFRELGNEEKARLLQEEAVQDVPPETEALATFYLAFIPFAMRYERNSIIPLNALKQVDAEAKILLPQLKDVRLGYDLYQWLVQGYTKVGQTEAARAYFSILEQLAFAAIAQGSDINSYNSVFEVTRLWRQTGNEAQVQRLLQKVDQTPLPREVTRRDVARAMIYNGFIEEGRNRWEALPKSNADKSYSPEIGYWEAKYQPHIFPSRIAKITNLQVRTRELVAFTNGLTTPLYETPQEREFVLSRGGYSSAF